MRREKVEGKRKVEGGNTQISEGIASFCKKQPHKKEMTSKLECSEQVLERNMKVDLILWAQKNHTAPEKEWSREHWQAAGPASLLRNVLSTQATMTSPC